MFDENHDIDHSLFDNFVNDIVPEEPTDNVAGYFGANFSGIHLGENISTQVLKLDVHGRLGLISHAESISSVKKFLVQYCNDRKREGYIMLQDPLSNFYNALCIGLDGDYNPEADVFLPQTSRATGDRHVNQDDGLNQPEEGRNGVRLKQRERTGKMKLRDLAGYFHLPISAASKEMNICPSALKGICRKEGLLRWPHRKIKSIESKISKKKQSLNSNDANERARALTEIEELQRELANVYEGNVG
ncbi:hypothetical protein DH2020_046563 [Rehmannia glutinosa]|uniref:RWP-RK domain-containing protein n=1 Tax=Rehmannia glutinosa TaxID=99300 RepID=A0ABR0UC05_REHGL